MVTSSPLAPPVPSATTSRADEPAKARSSSGVTGGVCGDAAIAVASDEIQHSPLAPISHLHRWAKGTLRLGSSRTDEAEVRALTCRSRPRSGSTRPSCRAPTIWGAGAASGGRLPACHLGAAHECCAECCYRCWAESCFAGCDRCRAECSAECLRCCAACSAECERCCVVCFAGCVRCCVECSAGCERCCVESPSTPSLVTANAMLRRGRPRHLWRGSWGSSCLVEIAPCGVS
jgi:hypothetical protein